jgi:aspartyl aminopeptidase
MNDVNPVQDLLAYLAASPSPYHAVEEAAARLSAAGFTELAETQPWKPAASGKPGFVRRGGALIAWRAPSRKQGWAKGVRIIGAHTDSPNLRVKPQADVSAAGYWQVGVEVYGGVLNNSWLDRDLAVSGRLTTRTGTHVLVNTVRPVARVAQLAIHLDREVNEKGLVLDKQLHLLPFTGLSNKTVGTGSNIPADDGFVEYIARSAGVDPADLAGHDLMFHDTTPPALLGINNEFITSGRLDNLFSCWAAVQSLVSGSAAQHGQLIALFDHEEVGSSSTTGAAGPLLERVLQRVFSGADMSIEQQAVALALSICVSSDMAHAVHPNYADRHEPMHRPMPNGGPVIKSNANQRYASTTDTAAMFAAACDTAGVPHQVFVSKNSMPCGSTIGPITATRLGIDTVDVGCAMLSMHSARELCGAADADLMTRALSAYLAA